MISSSKDRAPVFAVVVAEDEMMIRMMAVDALTEAGFEVIEAGHAEEAVSILGLQAADIHALFTDIHMPGPMDGLQLAHHVHDHWPWVVLLVTSGKSTPAMAEMPAGSRFLPKPYHPSHAIAHLRELIAAK